MSTTVQALQVFSISTSLVAAGGIAALSLFDIPELQAQPASRSLPAIRWLFSRGSHIFPQAAALSSAGFAYLAYAHLPSQSSQPLLQLLRHGRVPGYIAAAVLSISIAPFTAQAMVPTNFAIIRMNKDLGGASSQNKAKEGQAHADKSASDGPADTDGAYEASEFKDLSLPQVHTERASTAKEDKEASELLDKFGKLNLVRAVLMLAGGVVGLVTALP